MEELNFNREGRRGEETRSSIKSTENATPILLFLP